MKKTLITLLALSGIAMGETAGTTTLTPLTDTTNGTWTNQGSGTLNTTAGTLKDNGAWYIENASYALNEAILLNSEGDSLTFSITMASDNGLNFSAWVALEGSTSAVVAGHTFSGGTSDLVASTTTPNTVGGYDWSNTNDTDETVLTIGTTLTGVVEAASTTLVGNIAWSAEAGQFQLTLVDSTDATNTSAALNLGTTVDVSTLNIGINGKYAATTLSNFSVSTTLDGVDPTVTPGENVPEPTTATLSLLALAGLAARRRRK